jgi:hypothetical protein
MLPSGAPLSFRGPARLGETSVMTFEGPRADRNTFTSK